MTIPILIISLLLFLVVVAAIVISNLLRQISQLEDIVGQMDDREVEMFNVYNFLLSTFVVAKDEMDRVDKRGSFSSDDEVGFAFKTIKEAIEQVKYKLEQLRNDDQEQQE